MKRCPYVVLSRSLLSNFVIEMKNTKPSAVRNVPNLTDKRASSSCLSTIPNANTNEEVANKISLNMLALDVAKVLIMKLFFSFPFFSQGDGWRDENFLFFTFF